MKICIFTETYYPVVGGGETQARLLAGGLISNGHSVIVLTRRSDAALRQHENYGDVSVYRLGPVGSGQMKKWGLLLSSLPTLLRLRDQYDLIFVSGYRIIGLTAVLVGRLFRKPVVLKADSQGEMTGEFFESGLKKIGTSRSSLLFRLFLGLRNVILKKADAFSAISPEIASEWTSNRVPLDKIHLIPNSVDTTRFAPVDAEQKSLLREKLDLPHVATIAIYTGRLVSYKGLPLLLQVWEEIRYKHENALLLLAGTGGLDIHNCEAELREYVKTADLERNVLFLGARQNIPEYLQASDLFVFPTENDAFPSSLVEAMACGLPVVTTPVGAIKTIVTHQETGLIVEPGNHQQLYQAIVSILSDKPLTSRLGQAGRQIVEERYSAGNTVGKYLSLFESILSQSQKEANDRMKRYGKRMLFLALICLIIGLVVGWSIWQGRGLPFVSRREQWTIGIYRSESPFHFNGLQSWINPVLRAEDVTDVPAEFVADPFLVKEAETWYLFFEVYNGDTEQGDLAIATSRNSWTWHYEKVILDEPFHLSYPYVFQSDSDYYLIPESFEDNSVRLYKADSFPTHWTYVQTLVTGRDYVDNSIVYYNGKWWLFSSVTSNDTLYLHYADSLTGPWKEHPQSPIVSEDDRKARPSGRLLIYDNKLYRFTMDVNPPVGTHQVMAYEITEITPDSYFEKLAQEEPILMASGSGWNGQAMHQLDPVQIDSDSWIASVDGYGKYWLFGWQY